ncbi:hypothetical protein LVW35_27865 [Pseudomonas sp. HN11]|uniref:hypothetical protein n=1 Tax=Pseudomonas sp. HN11 TaxID=1344094 RepID=UPI001F3062E5|nr:hypothetical protein [Pseudomonas sp. HN11]UII71400.1 hypothetical protein LVW35_27865 [Pseudomonas sp. HN11]
MRDIDSKVLRYTIDFSRQAAAEENQAALQANIERHMDAARRVVTNETLERIGHAHLAVMINAAVRYNLSLAEIIMEAVCQGVQPVAAICAAVETAKSSRRITTKLRLHIVK